MAISFQRHFRNHVGLGLSASTTNVLWALSNLAIGFVLVKAGNAAYENMTSMVLVFSGVAVMSIILSISFRGKHKE